MLNALRAWFSRNDAAPEPPLCFVIGPDPAIREQLGREAGELGLGVEKFADPQAALNDISRQPKLVIMDAAVGAEAGTAIAEALTGGKLCGLQLVSAQRV